jgi:CubicO group peptidase (beta-lactamase class C family)
MHKIPAGSVTFSLFLRLTSCDHTNPETKTLPMNCKTYASLLVLMIICSTGNTGYAQSEPLSIKGTIVDSAEQKPLPAASVSISKKGIGTITNNNGAFQLSLPAPGKNDTLLVSYIGYRIKAIPVADIKAGRHLNIMLPKNTEELAEIVIEVEDPLKIIQKAIDRIPINYISTPYTTKGFYRLTSRKDQEYMQVSEAVFDIFNYGYGNTEANQFRLVKMRIANDKKATHGLDMGLKPKLVFDYDVIKNIDDFGLLSKRGLKDHRFDIRGITTYKGHEAYEITFDQKDGLKKSLYKGRLFIDTKTFAIMGLNYVLSPKGIQYARYGDGATQILLKLLGLSVTMKKDDIKIEYRKTGNKWVLADVTANTFLVFKSSRQHYNFPADIKVSYVVTEVDTTALRPFKKEERLGNHKLIEFQTTGQEADFWKDYTVILPDFDVAAVVKKIKERNEEYDLKKIIQPRVAKLPKNPALRIDSILSFYYSKGEFNGTVLIKHKGTVILNKSYGYANIPQQAKADSNTQYRIGSLSKSFTAMLVLQLVNEGKLQVTDPVKKYIPGYVHGNVTLEQLLTHSSGIPNFTGNASYTAEIMQRHFTHKEIVTRFCSDSLEFESGTKFNYSNSGYFLLAFICEQVTDTPFATLLQERIFKPLAMKDSYAGKDSSRTGNIAAGYLYGKPEPIYNTDNIIGAGGITSTASDLLKWDEALYTDRLLPKQKIEELLKPRTAYPDWEAYYGYGWMIDQYMFEVSAKAHKITYHPGTDMGINSMFARQEDGQNTVILLNNTGDFPRFEITDLILTALN